MRHVGHELSLLLKRPLDLLVGGLQLGQHPVKGGGQLADFVVRTGIVDAPAKITFDADGLRGLRDAVDGAQHHPR